jgi:hypothetical protein
MRDRLIRLVHEYGPDIALALGAIAIFVVTPPLFGVLIADADRKDSVDLALKILGTFLAVAASIASYRRFFRGRVFAPRLKLGLTSRFVCQLADGTMLHTVDIEVDNVGGVTIWKPKVSLRVLDLDSDRECSTDRPTTEGIAQPLRFGGIEGIEPGETVVYHYRFKVPKSVEAFRVVADLTMDRRDAWHRSLTVANNPGSVVAG